MRQVLPPIRAPQDEDADEKAGRCLSGRWIMWYQARVSRWPWKEKVHCHDVHEGNVKAMRPTKARELFALTGQTNTEEEKKYTGGWSPTPFYEDARCRIKTKRTAARLILETYQIVIIWQVLSCVKVPNSVYMELFEDKTKGTAAVYLPMPDDRQEWWPSGVESDTFRGKTIAVPWWQYR